MEVETGVQPGVSTEDAPVTDTPAAEATTEATTETTTEQP
jgi:hypothetical protein